MACQDSETTGRRLALVLIAGACLVGCLGAGAVAWETPAAEDEPIEVEEILKEAAESARAVADEDSRDVVLDFVSRMAVETGRFELATAVANEIGHDFSRALALAIVAEFQAKENDLEGALRVVETIKHPSAKVRALSDIATALAKANRQQEAKAVLQRARREAEAMPAGFNSSELTRVAIALFEMGDVDAAHKIAQSITDQEGRASCLLSLVRIQTDHGQTTAALKTARTVEADSSRAIAFAWIAAAEARAGRRSRARRILQRAIKLADRLQDDPGTMPFYQLRTWVFLGVVDAQCALHDVRGALASAEKIPHGHTKNGARITIATEMASQDKRTEARELFRRAIRVANTLEDMLRLPQLREIATAQAEAGFIAEAFETVKIMESRKTPVTIVYGLGGGALAEIARVQAEAGDLAAALHTSEKITGDSWRGVALFSITTAMAKRGDSPRALRLARKQTAPETKTHALLGVVSGWVEREREKKQAASGGEGGTANGR